MSRLPGPRGLRQQLQLARQLHADPHTALLRMRHDYGPVLEFGRGTYKYIYVLSPEANEHILATDPQNFTWKEAFQPLVAVNGETALVVSDGEEHQRRRRLVQPAFHIRRISSYLEIMSEETNRVIDTWRKGTVVDAYAAYRVAIRRIVLRCLFGPELHTLDDRIGEELEICLAYVNRPPLQRLDWNIPGLAYRRVRAARANLDQIIFAEITRRRATTSTSDDILGWLLESQADDALTDQEVRDQVVSLIAAGYDTTASTMGWITARLTTDPEHSRRIRAEVDDAGGINPITIETLSKLPYTAAFVKEALRAYPPAIWSGRTVTSSFDLHGHTIPAGEKVLFSPYVTHHLPDEFPSPDAFRPGRWIDGDPHQHSSHPYAYIPFGGGPRRCLGFAFATQELITMTAIHAFRTRSELAASHFPTPAGTMSNAPAGGVQLHIRNQVPHRPTLKKSDETR